MSSFRVSDDSSVAKKIGFIQTFGIDVRVCALTVIDDVLAFSTEIVSAGLLYPVEIGAAVVLGYITYKIQKDWYGDDHDSALIKAIAIGLLTAIPAPITPVVAGPSGLLGLIHFFSCRKR